MSFRKVHVDWKVTNQHHARKYVKTFKNELLNYKKTRHDNVELFLGACLILPNLAIVTRNYRGWRLDVHMRESSPTLDHARMIAEHICQGLGYLHSRGIVHRDLRPANVMFDQAGKVTLHANSGNRTGKLYHCADKIVAKLLHIFLIIFVGGDKRTRLVNTCGADRRWQFAARCL